MGVKEPVGTGWGKGSAMGELGMGCVSVGGGGKGCIRSANAGAGPASQKLQKLDWGLWTLPELRSDGQQDWT